jgi:paraquat-inducible protein B
VNREECEEEIERLQQHNIALTAQHKCDVQQTRNSVKQDMTELQKRLTQMTEQTAEQKKQTAGAKAQMTRVRTEIEEIKESRQVLRTALTVKTFQLTELQSCSLRTLALTLARPVLPLFVIVWLKKMLSTRRR